MLASTLLDLSLVHLFLRILGEIVQQPVAQFSLQINLKKLTSQLYYHGKNILNAFGLTDKNIEYRANRISEELKKSMMKETYKNGER